MAIMKLHVLMLIQTDKEARMQLVAKLQGTWRVLGQKAGPCSHNCCIWRHRHRGARRIFFQRLAN